MGSKNSAFALLFVAMMPACFHTEIRAGGITDTAGMHSSIANHYFWGIKNATFNVNDCHFGVANARTWKPWYASVVALFTLGIVSPQRLKYTCVAAPAPAAPVVVQMVAPASVVTQTQAVK